MSRLSICIPTYNRAADVAATVTDLAQQATADVEIVISNNGSTDDTAQRLAQVVVDHPSITIRVLQQTTNVGFDRNVLAVVAAAQGDYCWLLSDDDGILPGGIAAILKTIEQQPATTYLLNYQRYDAVRQRVTAERMIDSTEDMTSTAANAFYFRPTPRPSYFQILGTNMITMSVNVFKRAVWEQVLPQVQEYIGKNFIHIFVLTSVMRLEPQSVFIAQPWVRYLSNHHRNWDNDVWADYKTIFLPHLERLGYDPQLVAAVKRSTINHRTFTERMVSFIRRFIPFI